MVSIALTGCVTRSVSKVTQAAIKDVLDILPEGKGAGTIKVTGNGYKLDFGAESYDKDATRTKIDGLKLIVNGVMVPEVNIDLTKYERLR